MAKTKSKTKAKAKTKSKTKSKIKPKLKVKAKARAKSKSASKISAKSRLKSPLKSPGKSKPKADLKSKAEVERELIRRRRSSRVLLRIPLIVAVKNPDGELSWHPAETQILSRHGALIQSLTSVGPGGLLEVIWRSKNRTANARVIWAGKRKKDAGFDVALEFVHEGNFWEVWFVPDPGYRPSDKKREK